MSDNWKRSFLAAFAKIPAQAAAAGDSGDLPRAAEPSSSARDEDEDKTLKGWGPLHSGATWTGVQKSGRNSYQVKVTLETVDFDNGKMTGLLEIHGLTPDIDKLVTYFEGEIVTNNGPGFVTARWGATEKEDLQHWARFTPFHSVKSQLSGPKMNYNHLEKPFLFMRWKEQFVLPDSKIKNIHGASFAGFYYLCLSLEEEAPRIPPIRRMSSASRPSPPASLSPPRLPLPSRSPPPSASGLSAMIATSPPPMRPRSISYAAALRGNSPSPPVITVAESITSDATSIPSQPSSPVMSRESTLATNDGAVKEPEAADSLSVVTAPIPINLPNGMTLDDFPVPTSPPLNSPPTLWGSLRRGRRASSSTAAREHVPPTSMLVRKDEQPNYGMRSWTRARLTGFYYFKNSEPFQELELSYAPRNKGGSPTFAVC